MAHQFNGDFWEHRFLQGIEGKKGDDALAFQDVRKAAEAPGAALARELQADQYGVIYAVLAGYDADTLFTGDRNFLLEWAEKSAPARAHEKEFRTYLSQREKAIEMRLAEVAEQVGLFKLGVASFSAGRQDEALLLFRRFAIHFPSREVFANIGTVHLANAYTKFLSSRSASSFPFELAFGIEGQTRAETIDVARGFNEERFADYKAAVRESIQALERAISHDPTYAPARNSLGCAFLIDGRLYDAVSALETACRLDPGDARYRSNLAVAYLLLGQEIRSGSLTEKGEKILAELEGKLSVARRNWYALRVFRGEAVDAPATGDGGEWPMPLAPPAKNELAMYRSGTTLRTPGSVRVVEEFSEGKTRYRVYAGPGNTIFVLERNGAVRLALQRGSGGELGKGGSSLPGGVLVSLKDRNGYIYANGRAVDYFEF
jgi:tetratricopeptide (TPR) repeat protein